MRYAAFLRGINVGGHKALTMDALRATFQGVGFENVRTIQASGNVVFDAGGEDVRAGTDAEIDSLAARIGDGLEQSFGYRIGVIVRRLADLERLVASDPFQGVAVSPETRLYATFLSRPVKNGTEIRAENVSVHVVRVTEGEVLTAITLSPGWGTTKLMGWLEKLLGKDLTTRNWKTVLKIVGAQQAAEE
jgi:uncharacterized protein (DUF1697 family)